MEDDYTKERDRKHEEFMRDHTKKVRILEDLQVLHEVMNRYAELSNGWTRDSLVVEREMNVSKQEVLRRMNNKTDKRFIAILFISLIVNILLTFFLIFR